MSPFRELFVELPSDLFDVLKGIGEEAARRASGTLDMSTMGPMLREVYNPSRVESFVKVIGQSAHPVLLRRLGLVSLSLRRSATRDELDVIATRRCGHPVRGRIPEESIEHPPAGQWEGAAIRALETAVVKRCYCVEVPGDG